MVQLSPKTCKCGNVWDSAQEAKENWISRLNVCIECALKEVSTMPTVVDIKVVDFLELENKDAALFDYESAAEDIDADVLVSVEYFISEVEDLKDMSEDSDELEMTDDYQNLIDELKTLDKGTFIRFSPPKD